MKKIITIFAIIFNSISFCFAQENYVVREIRFKQNQNISDEELMEQITHYPTGWFSDVILFEDPFLFSTDIFEQDKNRIIKHYQRNGFIDAEIAEVNLLEDSDSRTLEIEIIISENIPVKVSNFEFLITGAEKLAFLESIDTQLSLIENVRFTEKLLNIDKNKIIDSLINNGYPEGKVDFDLSLDTLSHTVKINWMIDEGEYSKFGKVGFEGNKRTDSAILKRKLKFSEGDEYQAKKLDLTQKSIYDLGLFYIVSIKSSLEKSNEKIPIYIKLEEAPRYNTKFGIGYGRDEQFRISLEERILSFLGGARQLKIYAKHSALEPYHFRLDFLQPDFLSEYTNLTVSPFLIKQTEPAFKLNKFGFDIRLQRPLFKDIIASVKYTFERSDLDTNSISREELEFYDLVSVYNKSGIEFGLERSVFEPIFEPREGSLSSFVIHYSGLGLNSKYHFLRPTVEYRRYTEAAEWLTFAFRLKVGTILSFDSDEFVPYEERFYSGGSSSVRGWGRAELGPEDKDGQPLGGKSLFEGNLEFRYPIYSLLSGVLFMDYGNVWLKELTYNISDFRYSAGIGLRVSTPIGPVRFDLAAPVFEGASQMQYFISVGHAF